MIISTAGSPGGAALVIMEYNIGDKEKYMVNGAYIVEGDMPLFIDLTKGLQDHGFTFVGFRSLHLDDGSPSMQMSSYARVAGFAEIIGPEVLAALSELREPEWEPEESGV